MDARFSGSLPPVCRTAAFFVLICSVACSSQRSGAPLARATTPAATTTGADAAVKPDEAPAATALARIKAPKGFDLTLFAGPPDVRYPTSVAAAPDGTLFVAIDENGALGAKPGRGKVVRCRDRDGDGRADEFVTFAAMDSPRGVIWDGPTLYVVHPPFVTAYHDDDSDGRSDRSENLVEGLGFDLHFRGADHSTNGGRLGLDGFLYIAVGDYGAVKATGRDGRTLQMKGGGVVRVRVDGTGLEAVSRGQRNIYDVAISPTMDLFTRDNTNDGDGWNDRLSHVVRGGQYGYPSLFKNFAEDIIQPLADYGTGSPTGALFLDEPGFPGTSGHGLYTVEWGRRAVFKHELRADGAGWKADSQEEFLAIQRPTDMDVDGAGHLYVASWEGAVFNYAGPNAGYIVRVTPKGSPARKPLSFVSMDDRQVVEALALPSATWRFAASRELVRRQARGGNVTQALASLAASDAALPSRVAALVTLATLGGAGAREPLMALAQRDELREFALRALGDVSSEGADRDRAVTLFGKSLTDANPRVRLQAVTALERVAAREAGPRLLERVASDADPLVAHVAVHALVTLGGVDPALRALGSKNAKLWGAALRVLHQVYDPTVVDGLVAALRKARTPAQRHAVVSALCRLARREAPYDGKWWGTRPDTNGPVYKAERWASSDAIDLTLRRTLEASSGAEARFLIAEIGRHRVTFEGLTALMLAKAGRDTASRLAAVEALFGPGGSLEARPLSILQEVARAPNEIPELRARALRLLARAYAKAAAFDVVIDTYAPLAGHPLPHAALTAAFAEFSRDSKHNAHVDELAKMASSPPEARRTLAQTILVNLASSPLAPRKARDRAEAALEPSWANAELAPGLLHVVGQEQARIFGDRVRVALTSTDHRVAEAAASALNDLGLDAKAKGPGEKTIDELPIQAVIAASAAEAGDAQQGQLLFTRQGCIACHTVSSSEPPKGPLLGGIGTRYNRTELCESILTPSARIAQGFESQWFRPRGGEQIDGFVTRESGEDVEVRLVTGVAVVLKKSDLAARGKRDDSIMPPGLVNNLTPHELSSLLAYLQSLPGT